MTWIAGLDIVYAIQDVEFDVKENLHSMPVRLGKRRALVMSAACYLVSISAMIYAGLLTHKNVPYWTAVVLVGIIFFYQQRLARSKNITLAIRNFFKANIYISPILFFGTLTDVFIGKIL